MRSDIVNLITKSTSCATVVWEGEQKCFTENAHSAKINALGQRSPVPLIVLIKVAHHQRIAQK